VSALQVEGVNAGSCMKSGGPWHVKGVHPGARHSAQDAARRAGMSVGEWLNSVILDSAADDHDQQSHHDPYAPPSHRAQRPPYDPLAEQVAAINRQLEGLTEGFETLVRSTSASRATWPEHDGTARRLADTIARLDQRVEQLAQEGRNASKALERRVESVDRALSSLGRTRMQPDTWGSPMDRAMAEIQQRQHELDGDPHPQRRPTTPPPRVLEDFSDIHDRLRHITDQIDSFGPGRMQEAINALRNDLADIARTLTEASPRRAIETLEGEVRVLASRIDTRGGGAAFAKVEQGLAEVRETLRTLTPAENLSGVVEAIHAASRRIDQIASGTADPNAMHQLETAIAGLRDILSHVASRDALAALTDEVRALAARIDSAPAAAGQSNDVLRTLEQRIATIADAIESVRASGQAGSSDIDAMVRTLGDKIERLHAAGADQPGFAQLEGRINQLVHKLDASEARLGNLDAIERGMQELLGYLADMRSPPAKPVETIAREVRRAEETIEAVQGTIGDVVDRLAMIETGIRAPDQGSNNQAPRPAAQTAAAAYQTMPAVQSPPLQAAQPHVHAVAGAQRAVQSAQAAPARAVEPQRQQVAVRPAVAQARPAADGTLPYDFPLEPGSGKPRPGMASPASNGGGAIGVLSSPAERIAKSKAVLEPAPKPAAPADGEQKSNFILAARRAAQFAAENQDAAPAVGHYPGVSVTDSAAKPSLLRRVGRLIKPVLIGASVILLLAAAIHMAVNWFSPGEPAAEAPKETPKPQTKLLSPNTLAKLAQSDFVPTSLLGLGGSPNVSEGGAGVLPPAPPKSSAAPVAPPVVTVPPLVPVTSAPLPAVPMPAPAPAHAAATPMPLAPPAAAPAPKIVESPERPAATAAVSLAPPDVTGSISARKLSPPPAGLFPNPQMARAAALPAAIGGKTLLAAAEAGDASAAYEVALRYFEGRGVVISTEEAAAWFERAARKGLTLAMFRLGGLYEKGTGVKKDLQRARSLYSEAADRGNAKAMHNLAVLYADGIDGKPDYGVAVRWFHKAAARGVADSQYNLGVLYARGIGMEQNLAESYKWFALAAQTGDKDAAQKRDDVSKRLDAQTIAAVNATLQKWAPEPQPDDAAAVYAPPGGWDQGAPAGAKPKSKRAQTSGVKAL
jgi:localization factor PodJL